MHSTIVRDLLGDEFVDPPGNAGGPDVVQLMSQAYVATRAGFGQEELGRLDRFAQSILMGQRQTPADAEQKPLGGYFPGLRARPWWDDRDDPVTSVVSAELARGYPEIRHEVLARIGDHPELLKRNPTGERYSSLRPRDWVVCNLLLRGEYTAKALQLFPRTCAIIESVRGHVVPGGKVGIIVLRPGTQLPLHTDATNAQLTCHLPLVVPPGCGIRVAGQTREWVEGQPLFFDHSYEHEAWNHGDRDRVMLLLNLVHPDLTPVELAAWRKFYEHLSQIAKVQHGAA